MSTAPGDRKSDIEGTPGAGGPKGAAELTGGYMNYVFIVLNLVLAWLGMLLVLASLAALQHQYNETQDIASETNNWLVLQKDAAAGTNGAPVYHTFAGFAINSGYPALPPGRLLRFEWWVSLGTFNMLLCTHGGVWRKVLQMLMLFCAEAGLAQLLTRLGCPQLLSCSIVTAAQL